MFLRRITIIAFLLLSQVTLASHETRARRIWDRIVGTYSLKDEPKVAQMAALIANGQAKEAAAIATAEKRFIDHTILRFAAPWTNRDRVTNVAYNAMIALVQGSVRDKKDFREVFYGNYLYRVNPNLRGLMLDNTPNSPADPIAPFNEKHFQFIPRNQLSAYDSLDLQPGPQYAAGQNVAANYTDFSGIFTVSTAGFLYEAGTNRRAVEWAFKTMHCKDMSKVFDASRGDAWVGKDVDRSDPLQYQTKCIGCHGILDGMRGAFAFVDAPGFQMNFRSPTGTVASKYGRSPLFPDGYVTKDTSWENRATENHNQSTGWRGATSGMGISALAKSFTETDEFGRCMAKQVFNQICVRAPSDKELEAFIKAVAESDFENRGYQLHHLYEAIAANEKCISE